VAVDFQEISRGSGAELVIELRDAPYLECMEVVRRVPGKRVVCYGQWNGHDVYAKIFLGSQAQRYARRDQAGMQALRNAGILSPPLLYAGTDASGAAEVLIFQAIGNSSNAESVWEALPPHSEERLNLAKRLIAAVAAHHNAGLMQTDLYLKNFLLQGQQVFTLDGDAIRRLPFFFTRRTAINNLALLLSRLDVMDVGDWLPSLLTVYAQARSWANAPDSHRMKKRIAVIRRRVVSKYADRKVFRECTNIKVIRTRHQFQAVSRSYCSSILGDALANLDPLLEAAQSQRLKSGNTCTVALAEIDNRKVVIKRYNVKNFWHGLGRALRQSRAAISWSNAYRLQMHEIATASPVALVERHYGSIRRQAYFLAEYVDAPDIHDFFANAEVDETRKRIVAKNVAQLFYKLNLLKISHGDFKATNVKVVGDQPLLIDLDSMRQHKSPWLFERRHLRDLRRFLRNWQQVPQTRMLLTEAFAKFYKDQRLLQRAGWV